MSWKKAKLSECCQSISDGDHQAPPKSNKGIPFVTISNIKDNSFDFTDCMYVPQSYYDNLLAKRKPQKGDILYSVVGSFGIPVLMKENVKLTFQRHIAILRPNPHIVEPAYMYYSMLSKAFFLQADAAAIGAAQRTISLSSLQNLTINLPDLPTQRRIASILSAYDDLIENNRRQIKLLEEAAQRLYREWFVELRFPGHEGVKVVDGVPEGWKKVTIADSLAFHIGGGWGKETTNGKNTVAGKVIRGTDINDIKNGDFGSIPLRYHTENDILKRVLHPNDIVFELSNGNINNIGRCLMIDNTLLKNLGCNTICASFCKLLRPHDEMISHLLYWEIQDMQNSGRMLPLKKHGSNGINNFDFDGFLKHEYLLPLEKRFVQPLIYIMQKISNIQSQLVFLQEARDRLLSKLMSGEMEV